MDDWQTVREANTRDTGLGMRVVDLPAETPLARANVVFAIYWLGASNWQGTDFVARIGSETIEE